MAITLQIVGYKNAGKTTLMSSFISLLKKDHYTVAALKHDSHDFDVDTPNTDSYRFTTRGADAVMISSAQKFALLENKALSLKEVLEKVPNTDILLIEGYKNASFPKIVLVRNNEDYLHLSDQLTNIIAFASYKMNNNPNVAFIEDEQRRTKFAKQIIYQLFPREK